MKKRILDYRVLWTENTTKIKLLRNRLHAKDIYNTHIWVHNGVIEKNHTPIEEERLPHICNLSNVPFILDNIRDGWGETRNRTTVNEEDYIYCKQCKIDNTGERMCPCPRGGCDAETIGKIKTTIEISINK